MGIINRLIYRFGNWSSTFLRPREPHEKLYIDHHGEVSGAFDGSERRAHVRFPVNLAVRYGDSIPLIYEDFVLNLSKGGVYIITDHPLPPGSIITMHFFIPPEQKLLGEFNGEVVQAKRAPGYPDGMHVAFFDLGSEELNRLEAYLEEKRPLLNINV